MYRLHHESDPAGQLAPPHTVSAEFKFHVDVHWHASATDRVSSTNWSVVGSSYSYYTVTLACSYDGHRWLELHDLYDMLANNVH